jgi:tetraacyldisaccharide 4'-kinase
MWGPAKLFGVLARARRRAYEAGWVETVRLPVPVFCLGGLTVGGVGKTPGVIWLVEVLKALGKKPGVVSRGYGRKDERRLCLAGPGETIPSVADVGDEARLIFQRTGVPLAVAADRARAAEALWETHRPDVLVMDDGLQHFRLYRDRNLLCWDAAGAVRALTEGPPKLLPAGPAREGEEALDRVHLIFFTRAERLGPGDREKLRDRWARPSRPAFFVRSHLSFKGPEGDVRPDSFRGKTVVALSALGDPSSFEASLADLGAAVTPVRFRDHHAFTGRELARVRAETERAGAVVVTTEKDDQKLPVDFVRTVARLDWEVEEDPACRSAIASGIF